MTRAALGLAAGALLAALVGCGGGAPADLFVVTRSGSIPGARLTLRMTDDGRASCNGRPLVDVTSPQLLVARQAARDLEEPARAHLRLPAGAASVLSYRVRGEEGEVAWSDSSRGQPPVLFRLAKLTRDVARGACGLPR
jgi:hypothetical protein